jgi:hypothetical protein
MANTCSEWWMSNTSSLVPSRMERYDMEVCEYLVILWNYYTIWLTFY